MLMLTPLSGQRITYLRAKMKQSKNLIEQLAAREALLDALPGLAFEIEQSSPPTIRYISEQIHALTGVTSESLIGQPMTELLRFIHPEDHTAWLENILGAFETCQPYSLEYRLVNKDGHIRHMLGQGKVVDSQDNTTPLFYGTALDVTDGKKVEKRTRAILETAPDSILVVDKDRKILLVNKQTEQMFGYQSSELLGKAIETLLPNRYRKGHPKQMQSFFSAPTFRQMGTGRDLWAVRKNGSEFPVEISLSPLQTEEGLLVSAAVRDITARKHVELELLKAKDAAEDATQAKSNFLANMSHEIRTPMNAIIGMSHLALQTDLDNKQKNYIEKVNQSAQSLLGIINDILDFSKIEAGMLDIEKVDFNLKAVLNQFSHLVGFRANEKSLELLVDIKPDVPFGLVGDPMRLGQILVNLGGNAVKFTETGEVVLNIELLNQKDQQVELKFSMTDTGIGMNAKQQSKLFQSFSQADSSTTREYGGTGLGLSISKKLTELMGGQIGVSSQLNKGSCFAFTAKFETSVSICEDELTLPESLRKLRVLIVDDNEQARVILSKIISTLGFDVDIAEGGRIALSKITNQDKSRQPYKLAIIDWLMPDMDGIELIHEIQNSADISPKPAVIMATAHDKNELNIAAKSAGVNLQGIVIKPLTSSNVFNSIMSTLGQEKVSMEDMPPEAHEQHIYTESLQGAHVLLVEDNLLNQELATELLQSNGIQVTLAENGQVALKKLREQDFDGVLMDCQMPIMDGYQATKEIRKQARFHDLPIIAMTANVMVQDLEKARQAGMNDYIGKPLNISHMFKTMSQWIHPQGNKTVPAIEIEKASVDSLRPDLEQLVGINVNNGLKRTQNNLSLYLKLLNRFKQGMSDFEHRFNDVKALSDAKRLAHTLKGNAGNIGAEELYELAQELEDNCQETASNNTRQACLVAVVEVLEPILKSLENVLVDQTTQVPISHVLGKEKVDDYLRQIKHLIEASDTEAVTVLRELLSGVSEPDLQKDLQNIEALLNEYDFELALQEFNSL